ncbi:hypothetical protein RUND412_010313, partial [Rhizina undulata]
SGQQGLPANLNMNPGRLQTVTSNNGGQIKMPIQQVQPQHPGNVINVRNNRAVPPQLRQQRLLGNVNLAPGMARMATPNNGGQIRMSIQQAQNQGPFTHAQQKLPGNSNNFGNRGALPP